MGIGPEYTTTPNRGQNGVGTSLKPVFKRSKRGTFLKTQMEKRTEFFIPQIYLVEYAANCRI